MTHRLLSLELGFALLEKGPGSLAHVLGAGNQTEQRGLVRLRLGKRHLQPSVDRIDDVAHRDRGLRGERGRELPGFRHQIRHRHDTVDEPQPVRFLRADWIPGQQNLQRVSPPDEPSQALCSGIARDDAEVDLGLADSGRIGVHAIATSQPPPSA